MKFFIDSADTNEIRELTDTGLVDGVTTNPSLIAKSGRNMNEVIKEICSIVEGPVSAEVTATDYDGMVSEGRVLSAISKNVTVKVPLTWNGLKACTALRKDGALVNVTLCFSSAQALLAAKAGATFISPFVGRLDDISQNGIDLIKEIREIYKNYSHNLSTEILVASIRSPRTVIEAAKIGADVCTMPTSIMHLLSKHPLTDKGLEDFLKDWKKTGQVIE